MSTKGPERSGRSRHAPVGPFIGVVGPSSTGPDVESVAHEVGRLLARAGCAIVCGGLGGVMEAACRGAKSASGLTIGILPGTERSDANPFVDVAVATGMGEARNVVIVWTADCLVAVGGGYGTLSEIGHALRLGKRVVALDSWQVSLGGRDAGILRASDPEQAVRMILS